MISVVGLVASAVVITKRWPALVALAVVLAAFVHPLLGMIAGVAVLAWTAARRRRDPIDHAGDEPLLADLTVLGLSAGLTFPSAAETAAGIVPGEASDRLRRALRLRGAADPAPVDDVPLMIVARRALSTGAPLVPAVSAHAVRLRDDERSRQLAAARRLPVKLLFPLALLILPGFLLLTIGPAVLGSLERLGF